MLRLFKWPHFVRSLKDVKMAKKRVEWIQFTCGICGKKKTTDPYTYKRRVAKAKNGLLFCSSKCLGKHNMNLREQNG